MKPAASVRPSSSPTTIAERIHDRYQLAADQLGRAARESQRTLHARALLLTHDRDRARDLVQDTWLKALRSLDRFEPGTNMLAWLIRIMVNLFIDRCRRDATHPAPHPLPDQLAATAPEPEPQTLSERIDVHHLRAALAALDPMFRQPYQLRIEGKLSYQQIAAELRIPVSTVGTRLIRARQRLRRALLPVAAKVEREGEPGGEVPTIAPLSGPTEARPSLSFKRLTTSRPLRSSSAGDRYPEPLPPMAGR